MEHISFSAHADFDQTNGFLNDLAPPNVVLVHGEAGEMGRLKEALERSATALNMPRTVHTPKNNQGVLVGVKRGPAVFQIFMRISCVAYPSTAAGLADIRFEPPCALACAQNRAFLSLAHRRFRLWLSCKYYNYPLRRMLNPGVRVMV